MSVRGIEFAPFYNFAIWFWNCWIVWHLCVFHFITICCYFYSGKQKGQIVSKTKLVNQLQLINSFIFISLCLLKNFEDKINRNPFCLDIIQSTLFT